MKEIFTSAPMQNHQLGVTDGNEGGRYALSLNYFHQQGIDLMINYADRIGSTALSQNVGVNYGSYRNTVTKITGHANTQYFGINDKQIQKFVVTHQDFPISSFYGYTIDGIFQTNEE